MSLKPRQLSHKRCSGLAQRWGSVYGPGMRLLHSVLIVLCARFFQAGPYTAPLFRLSAPSVPVHTLTHTHTHAHTPPGPYTAPLFRLSAPSVPVHTLSHTHTRAHTTRALHCSTFQTVCSQCTGAHPHTHTNMRTHAHTPPGPYTGPLFSSTLARSFGDIGRPGHADSTPGTSRRSASSYPSGTGLQ